MSWNAYLVRTMTGEVGTKLEPENLSWNIPLNGIESGRVVVRKEHLREIERQRWDSDWGGILITRTLYDGSELPWVAGPITGHPKETPRELTLSYEGIRNIFETRHIEQTVEYVDLSYGAIAWELVKHGMNRTGGALPIVHGSPSEADVHRLKYDAWNLANNKIDRRLKELSEMDLGPDLMFRPVWANEEHTRIQWSFEHGTKDQPTLSQTFTPDWDSTAYESDVVDISISTDSVNVVDKVWYTGAGSGATASVAMSFSDRRIIAGYPLREKVMSDPDQRSNSVLTQKAAGYIKANNKGIDQVSMEVRAGSDRNPLGVWRVGDAANITVKDWFEIPDGTYRMRIIRASGDYDENVTLEFQEDSW